MIYKKVMLEQMPRILGLMDRNPLSKTYGCFDRNYWHYKISDFPCARFQEGVLTLALMYKMRGTEYHKNEKVLSWIVAGIEYWKNIQHLNGSFDEWYPKENSFVATAFSTYAITETLLILKNKIGMSQYLHAIERAGDWLSRKKEERAQNQEAGAAMALYNIFLLTGKAKFKKSSEDKLNQLLNSQTEEGWFHEYGGPDIGYLSLLIDYLAKYYKKTKNQKVLKPLKRSLEFLKYFIHPDLTSGGTYGSRNTEYLIPDGFEILSAIDKNAQTISSHIIKSLKRNKIVGTKFLDDRYLIYNGYAYLQAENNYYKNKKYNPMFRESFRKDFSRAGILVHSHKEIYFIMNYKKGGAHKHFKKNKLVSEDSGIEAKYSGTALFADTTEKITKMDDMIVLEGHFRTLPNQTLSPMKNILLRIFQSTLGINETVSRLFKEKMRNRLITKRKKTKFHFKREVVFEKNKIKINDSVSEELKISERGNHSYDFIPSSKYFQYSDLIT